MGREYFVLGQYTVNGRAKSSDDNVLGDISSDMIPVEICTNTVALFPALDVCTYFHNFTRRIGANNNILLVPIAMFNFVWTKENAKQTEENMSRLLP